MLVVLFSGVVGWAFVCVFPTLWSSMTTIRSSSVFVPSWWAWSTLSFSSSCWVVTSWCVCVVLPLAYLFPFYVGWRLFVCQGSWGYLVSHFLGFLARLVVKQSDLLHLLSLLMVFFCLNSFGFVCFQLHHMSELGFPEFFQQPLYFPRVELGQWVVILASSSQIDVTLSSSRL